jgi:hypothetical protein
MAFLKRYVLHHLWLGVVMIIEAGFLFWKSVFIWAVIYLAFGLFFLIDDILAETKGISVMKRLPASIQEENRLKSLGLLVFSVQFVWFLYLYLRY